MERHAEDGLGQVFGHRVGLAARVFGQLLAASVDGWVGDDAAEAEFLIQGGHQLVAFGAGPFILDAAGVQIVAVVAVGRLDRQNQPGNVCQHAVAGMGDAPTTVDKAVQLAELNQSDGGLYLGHHVGSAPGINVDAVHADGVRELVQVGVISGNHAAFAQRRHVFHGMEGKDGCPAGLADFVAFVAAAAGTGSIADDFGWSVHRVGVLFGDGDVIVNRSGQAVHVNREDGPGPRRHLALHVFGVKLEGVRQDITPDHLAAMAVHGKGRGHVVAGRHNHLVAGLELQVTHDDVNGRTAAVDRSGVLGAAVLGKGLLKVRNGRGGEAEPDGRVHGLANAIHSSVDFFLAVAAPKKRLAAPNFGWTVGKSLGDFMLKHHGLGLLFKINVDGMEARNSHLLRYYYNIDEIAVCKPRCMEKAVFDMDKIRMIAAQQWCSLR